MPGSCVMVTQEGTRPLLVEVQALVDTAHVPNPRRLSVGLDPQRLAMLLAVLHRHAGIAAFDQDVFVNAVGGVRITEPAADLAVLLAVVSSMRDRALPRGLVVYEVAGPLFFGAAQRAISTLARAGQQARALVLGQIAVGKYRGDVRFERRFVLREPRVPVDSVERHLWARHEIRSERPEVLRKLVDDREHRRAKEHVVLPLARLEPIAVVVPLQRAEKRERLRAEAGCHRCAACG